MGDDFVPDKGVVAICVGAGLGGGVSRVAESIKSARLIVQRSLRTDTWLDGFDVDLPMLSSAIDDRGGEPVRDVLIFTGSDVNEVGGANVSQVLVLTRSGAFSVGEVESSPDFTRLKFEKAETVAVALLTASISS